MKKKAWIAAGVVVLAIITVNVIWGRTSSAKNAAAENVRANRDWLVAGPGRVEPASEDIKIGAELNGKLKNVLVEEGDSVKRGQILAELVNSDYRAQVEAAAAEVTQKEAELRKVVNGARREERREALAVVNEARATMNHAESEMTRRKKLYAAGVISREEADTYTKEYEVAKARYEETVQKHALVDETAREEDRTMAEANLGSAKAKLDQARALLEKTYIRSPIDGTILRKHHRTGESVSNFTTTPDPIVTLGDKSVLRVRVDVDETDVSKLSVGQKVYVTADAFGEKRFWGHVIRVGQQLGRKNLRTDEPTEKVDTKILDTLVELDRGAELPVGLRVDAFIVGQTQ